MWDSEFQLLVYSRAQPLVWVNISTNGKPWRWESLCREAALVSSLELWIMKTYSHRLRWFCTSSLPTTPHRPCRIQASYPMGFTRHRCLRCARMHADECSITEEEMGQESEFHRLLTFQAVYFHYVLHWYFFCHVSCKGYCMQNKAHDSIVGACLLHGVIFLLWVSVTDFLRVQRFIQ